MALKAEKTDYQTSYQQRMNKVLDYIEKHIDTAITVEQLSQLADFSLFHFHRQFRAYTGIPVYELIQAMRLKRAAKDLVFCPDKKITELAYDSGFENAESFSRAFKKALQQSPREFKNKPDWEAFNLLVDSKHFPRSHTMDVKIINFPETLVATLEHHGPEHLIYNSTKKFIEWRKANGIKPGQGDTYGIHYSDPASTLPEDYRQDICVSVDEPVIDNPQGVITKTIPAGRCAVIRHHGSRDYIPEVDYIYREWLPESGEELRDFPPFFHYINVGPDVRHKDMITDVYLPIK